MRDVQDFQKMEISFINKDKETETISSWKLSRFKGNDPDEPKEIIPMSYCPIYKKPIGSLLFDVLSTDFYNEEAFKAFVDKWGFAALLEYSETSSTIIFDNYDEKEYKTLLNTIWRESKSELRLVQKELESLIYYCLDIDGPEWSRGLNNIQRYYLVQNLYKSDMPKIDKYIKGLTSKFEVQPINPTFNQFDFATKNHLSENEFARMIKDNEFEVVEIISSGNIAEICYAEFKELLLKNYSLRKCKNCGYYFSPSGRIDTEYCDRVAKTDSGGIRKTCKDIGAMARYTKKAKKDPIVSEYRRAYKTMHARTYATGNSRIEPSEWDTWKKEVAIKLRQAKQGGITIDDFKEWIKKSKEGEY